MVCVAGAAVSAQEVPQDPAAVGYLNLHRRHPDAAPGPTEFASYTSEEALRRLTQMQGFLDSFRTLTDKAHDSLTAAELKSVGNTDASMQTIGFHNIPLVVEATVLKQDYQLKQAYYELAVLKRGRGDIDEAELTRARDAYREAARRFQYFWDTKLPTD